MRKGGSEHPMKGMRASGRKALTPSSAAPSIADLQTQVGSLSRELNHAIERQTATAEVLQLINSSPGDLAPVFDAILVKAHRLCGVAYGSLQLYDGEWFRAVAVHNLPEQFADVLRLGYRGADHPVTRVLVAGDRLVHSDCAELKHPVMQSAVELAGIRTALFVPLRRDETLLGMIVSARREVNPFTDNEISLLEAFAAQAVIALENARLFDEVQARTRDLTESLQQQTATSEVLQVISTTPGDLEPVFKTMLENATHICGANFGLMNLCEEGRFRPVANYNAPAAYTAWLTTQPPFQPHPQSGLGTVARTKQVVHVADIRTLLAYLHGDPSVAAIADLAGARSYFVVPMLKENELIGAITIYRQEIKPFAEKQTEVVANFASQAVIAIENARLLNELRERTTELTQSLEDLRSAQDRLIQTEKLASLGQLTAGIAHEIKNPLNFVNNFAALSAELTDELKDMLAPAPLAHKTRTGVDELTSLLKDNLQKVVQHGARADSIVKNMLLHSREGSGEQRPVDINVLVDESLDLAYHGARAEKTGFSIDLVRDFDPAAGSADVYAQEISRVLLNLISNGFYAAAKRKTETGNGFAATLTATTKNLGDKIEIRIRDNGTGVPAELKEKIFNPFFTTKPAGEGTGLGLSMSHDIIVKQHGGTIRVDTKLGEFTEFVVTLPRATSAQKPERGA